MQLIEDRPAPAVVPQGVRSLPRLLPWALPVLIAVLGLVRAGVPLSTVLRYDVYFVTGVVLPGILLLRASWRSTGNWVEDSACGAAAGIAYQFAGWALFTALGIQSWLVAWPIAALVAFVALPKLRQYWRIAAPAPLPRAWSWGVAIGLSVLLLGVVAGPMLYHQAPGVIENHLDQPLATSYHQDLLYHLSMVHELTRSVPPQLPQVAGEPLDYHWFANADMAAAADVTGLSPALVLFRLWPVPLTAAIVLLTAVLARQICRRWQAAVVAVAVLAVPAAGVLLGHRRVSMVGTLIYYLSPSQIFALLTLTGAAVFLVDALYRCGRPGAWVWSTALALLGGGSKPTVLPTLLGGVALAGLCLAVRKRALPGRSLLAAGFLLGAGALAMVTVAGSTSGSGFRPLAVLRAQGASYQAATGDKSLAATGDLLLRPIADGRISVVVVLLLMLLISQLGMLVGFGLWAVPMARVDPAGWFLLGGLAAGWAAFLVVDHPSGSEYYFLRGLVPFAAVATAWMITGATRRRTVRQVLTVGVASLLLGVIVVVGQELVEGPLMGDSALVQRSLLRSAAVVVLVGVLVWPVWRVIRKVRPELAGMGPAVPALMVVGMSLAIAVVNAGESRQSQAPLVYISRNIQFTADEQAAARWLRDHSAPDDVVATNTACWPKRKDCVALGYLVTGLAGRRSLLEGWAYTQQAMSRQGVGGKAYMLQPSPWADRRKLTDQLFAAPTRDAVRRAHDEYGVRWLFADRASGRGPVVQPGPGLEPMFTNRSVTIFRITGK
jgi:hypothetical protein